MEALKVGDKVSWTSQSHGHTKTKEGVVAQVVRAGDRPNREAFPSLYKGAGPGYSRKTDSVVVMVGARPYWPLTNKLHRSEAATEDVPTPVISGPWQLGEKVRWTSSAGGHTKTKEGIVAEVVPAGAMPDRERFLHLYRSVGVGVARDHESVVVMVGTRPYWPRAHQLQRVSR